MLANAATLPEEDRQRFFEATPLNRETRAALLACSRVIEVSLASADAPRGKKLASADFITVRWTISTPGDQRIASESVRRQQVLRRLVDEAAAQNAAPTDDDLARALGVSRRTVLRDMQALVDSGVKIKTRQRTAR
jgi:AraC-like DNA-binding protein